MKANADIKPSPMPTIHRVGPQAKADRFVWGIEMRLPSRTMSPSGSPVYGK